MDLVNDTGERFRFRTAGWGFYLNLAEAYGWNAAGTLPPEKYEGADVWPGEYDWNAGQSVSSADTQALNGSDQRLALPSLRPRRYSPTSDFRPQT